MASLVILAGCGGGGGATPALPSTNTSSLMTSPIKHVIIVVQENRSLNTLFMNYPGAITSTTGQTITGDTVPLTQVNLEDGIDIGHGHLAYVSEYQNGKMNGFNTISYFQPKGGGPATGAGLYPYAYVNPAETAPYWQLAQQYTLGDEMFPTESSGSFTAHQDLIAGGDSLDANDTLVDFPSTIPWGCDAPVGTYTDLLHPDGTITFDGPFPCFKYRTIADSLDAANVSWKYYAPKINSTPALSDVGGEIWTAFDAISSVRYGPDWNNISSPETNVLSDIQNGNLASVSWVIPDFKNSDHSDSASNTGPSWVTSIVNTVGQSKYWDSTAIVVVWDDWGGWYDPVAPPQLDYVGLGFRVPMLVISPYAKHGYVDHHVYEFGSILKYVENNFGLASIGTTDARSTSIINAFDYSQTPKPFSIIQAQYSARQILSVPPSYQPPDEE